MVFSLKFKVRNMYKTKLVYFDDAKIYIYNQDK
jgi:hypothetical protein